MSSRVTACPECGTKNRVPACEGTPQCASCHAALPWLVDATDANLADARHQTPGLVTCGPMASSCRMVAPILERLAANAGDIKVVKVNVDDNQQAAVRFDARSIPTLAFVQNGEVVDRLVGAQPEHVFVRQIKALLAR